MSKKIQITGQTKSQMQYKKTHTKPVTDSTEEDGAIM